MPTRTRLCFNDLELLSALDELVRSIPGTEFPWPLQPQFHSWVGDARALIGNWDSTQDIPFAMECDRLFVRSSDVVGSRRQAQSAFASIMNVVQTARSELRFVTGGRVTAAFDAGQQFDFYDKLRNVIETAQRDVFFVDRWMGSEFVTQYLPHPRANVKVRLLTREKLAPLLASVAAFSSQHGTTVAVRTSGGFHGRFMCLDGDRCFLVDASFKDAAGTAPAALIELTSDITSVRHVS